VPLSQLPCHREGNTLVIDVTNFSPKTDFEGSRENPDVMAFVRKTFDTVSPGNSFLQAAFSREP
jgi:hypothetical protein